MYYFVFITAYYCSTLTKFTGAGRKWPFQFQGPSGCSTVCSFFVTVQKCRYCAGERDSVYNLAAQFGRHWSQIWSSNPPLLSPDTLLVGQLLTLGNSYRVQNGDTWSSISVRFGASVSLLQTLNPDFTPSTSPGVFVDSVGLYALTVSLNATMCIMPETCAADRPVVPGISW